MPQAFRSFGFSLRVQGRVIRVDISGGQMELTLVSGAPMMVKVYDWWVALSPGKPKRMAVEGAEAAPEARAERA